MENSMISIFSQCLQTLGMLNGEMYITFKKK